ncbi:MAG: helix-turn-helix transcriptional regulator [Treponemataceae bacterium]|nr:helix-turn-helix transcriptional regulator [Treponemataceae bacterium]
MSSGGGVFVLFLKQYMLDFWLRVKDKLDYQDTTQKELAQKIGETYNTLQSWINRNRLPNAEQSVKIAAALGTSVEFLVTGKSTHPAPSHAKTVELLKEAIGRLERNG